MKAKLACLALLAAATGGLAGEDDSWVEPMKAVRAKFTGQRGTVAQFGDSITITMAFFTPLSMEHKNVPADLVEAHAWIRKYVQPRCWRAWKGPQFGNEGRTTTEWGLANISAWLKKLNPEVALIMWGTNDTYQGPKPPKYTDNLRLIVQACLDNGTVPILYTIPPKGDQAGNAKNTAHVESFVEAARTVAAEKKIPLVDFYKEIMTRQPTEFHKTLLGDGLHPSYPQPYQLDFSEEALKHSGYTLRNYLTLKKLWEVYQKVLSPGKAATAAEAEPERKGPTFKGRPAVLVARPATGPAVDGRLDDPCWEKADPLPFRPLDGSADKPKHATWAKLLATDKTLFIAIQCAETDQLRSRTRDRDANIWEDDSVELFIKPGPEATRQYHHLIVNPEGSFLDDLGGDNEAWQSNLKLAVAKAKDAWSVEAAIPLDELTKGHDKAKLAGPWRLNLTRMRQPRGDDIPAEETALAPTEDPSSHVPDMFAYAWLEALGGKPPERVIFQQNFESDGDWDGDIETNNVPAGSKRALAGHAKDKYHARFIRVGIRKPPARAAATTLVRFRYFVNKPGPIEVMAFDLTQRDNYAGSLAAPEVGKWAEATLNITRDFRRKDGSPASMAPGDAIDDLFFGAGTPGEKAFQLLVDDVILVGTD